MSKWFRSECDEIARLNTEITGLKTALAAQKAVSDQYESYYQSVRHQLTISNARCEMYDKVMTGLRINVNLNEKKK